jgi:hypothetical protein
LEARRLRATGRRDRRVFALVRSEAAVEVRQAGQEGRIVDERSFGVRVVVHCTTFIQELPSRRGLSLAVEIVN